MSIAILFYFLAMLKISLKSYIFLLMYMIFIIFYIYVNVKFMIHDYIFYLI